MTTEGKTLGLVEKLKAEDILYGSMFHTGEGKLMGYSFLVALAVHIIILLINFPEFKKTVIPKKSGKIRIVKKYVPPPPQIERKQVVKKKLTRRVPIPDPTPDEPEPIREPEPEIEPEPLPPDVEFLIGVPEPPPPSGPLLAGVANCLQLLTQPGMLQVNEVAQDVYVPAVYRGTYLNGGQDLQFSFSSRLLRGHYP